VFEANPDSFWPELKLYDGCKYILSLKKRCYLLMPPSSGTTDYVADIKRAADYFFADGVLNDPNVYFMPAVYDRANGTHFVSANAADKNSIEAVVKFLKDYEAPNVALISAAGQGDVPAGN
jgi:hypothetical protein